MICVVTAHSAAYAPLAELTEPNKREYARRHGYDFRTLLLSSSDQPLSVGYQRYRFVLDVLELRQYSSVFWTGSDSLITNLTQSLEERFGSEIAWPGMIIANDARGINNDVVILRNRGETQEFLQHVLDTQAEYRSSPFLEQSAMEDFLPQYPRLVKFVPQRELNAYDYNHYLHLGDRYAQAVDALGNDGQWQPGDFLIHWPAVPNPTRIELVNQIQSQIQR